MSIASRFIKEMENIIYYLVASLIEKEFLLEIITVVINDEMADEGLKLKLFNVMSKNLGDEMCS